MQLPTDRHVTDRAVSEIRRHVVGDPHQADDPDVELPSLGECLFQILASQGLHSDCPCPPTVRGAPRALAIVRAGVARLQFRRVCGLGFILHGQSGVVRHENRGVLMGIGVGRGLHVALEYLVDGFAHLEKLLVRQVHVIADQGGVLQRCILVAREATEYGVGEAVGDAAQQLLKGAYHVVAVAGLQQVGRDRESQRDGPVVLLENAALLTCLHQLQQADPL